MRGEEEEEEEEEEEAGGEGWRGGRFAAVEEATGRV
jgi:hypothetical protein